MHSLLLHSQRLVLWIALCLLSLPAYAHNVIGGVYAVGNTIEGEIGFSNGDMAKAGTRVEVRDAAGAELGVVIIDDEGFFSFDATRRIDHHFYADLSSGHVIDLMLPAAELPASLPGGEAQAAVSKPVKSTASTTSNAELQAMIEQAVARQVQPLRREVAAYKEKAGLRDLIGGVGYIVGLVGFGIWWRQRQLAKTDKDLTVSQSGSSSNASGA